MRKIKFRGKRLNDFKEVKEWVYGQYQIHNMWDGSPTNHVRHAIHYLSLNESPLCNGHMLNEMEYISENTLGQYIGIKDINDVEIFEGDIVKAKTNIGYVKYNEKECTFEVCTLDWDIKFIEYSCWEIIGNIYDNKELLEG